MKIGFKTFDIVDTLADALICSGNVELNMSGGVNGEILSRGEAGIQKKLHEYLVERGVRYVEPGFAMSITPSVLKFKKIIYAVAIDAFYKSNIEMVEKALGTAFKLAQNDGCKTLALTALATGYGRLPYEDFAVALSGVLKCEDWPFESIEVVVNKESALVRIQSMFNQIFK